MEDIDSVEGGEVASPGSIFTNFPAALSYVRRIQDEVEETYCIISKEEGIYEVVPFVQGLYLVDNSGYRLIFAY